MHKLVGMWKRLTKDWEHQILRPILVSSISAVVLVSGALVFAPVRRFLFPSDERNDYPLLCTAEPVVEKTASGKLLVVDFYVINRTDEEQTIEKLRKVWAKESEESPTINLYYYREIGQINPSSDNNFNEDKADLEVKLEGDGKTVKIVPKRIAPRAIARVRIEVTGLPELEGITRASHGSIPFRYLDLYERACYTR